MRASDIMTSDVGCCTMDTSLRDCARMMIDCDCGAIPVVEDMREMRLIGVITDRDMVIRAVAKGLDPNTTLVGNCMSADVQTVHADAPLKDVERIMSTHQVRRIPIVDEANHLRGIVSQADLALAAPKPEVAQVVQEVSRPYVA